jgi:hypothetical protein
VPSAVRLRACGVGSRGIGRLPPLSWVDQGGKF